MKTKLTLLTALLLSVFTFNTSAPIPQCGGVIEVKLRPPVQFYLKLGYVRVIYPDNTSTNFFGGMGWPQFVTVPSGTRIIVCASRLPGAFDALSDWWWPCIEITGLASGAIKTVLTPGYMLACDYLCCPVPLTWTQTAYSASFVVNYDFSGLDHVTGKFNCWSQICCESVGAPYVRCVPDPDAPN